jgi:hypothetical protein
MFLYQFWGKVSIIKNMGYDDRQFLEGSQPYISTDNIGIWARKLQINQKLNKIKNAEFGSDVILIKQNY